MATSTEHGPEPGPRLVRNDPGERPAGSLSLALLSQNYCARPLQRSGLGDLGVDNRDGNEKKPDEGYD